MFGPEAMVALFLRGAAFQYEWAWPVVAALLVVLFFLIGRGDSVLIGRGDPVSRAWPAPAAKLPAQPEPRADGDGISVRAVQPPEEASGGGAD